MHVLGWALLFGGGALVYAMTRRPSATVGDAARAGDLVDVPVTALPDGALPAGFPPGTAIRVSVDHAALATLDGPVTASVSASVNGPSATPLTPPVGPVRVPRAAVTHVYRNGQEVFG